MKVKTQQSAILHYAFFGRNLQPNVLPTSKTNQENDATLICAHLNIFQGRRYPWV